MVSSNISQPVTSFHGCGCVVSLSVNFSPNQVILIHLDVSHWKESTHGICFPSAPDFRLAEQPGAACAGKKQQL